MLCIEVDENQHKYYDKDDEEARYNDVYMGFSGKFIFIRYNSDSFRSGILETNKDENNKKRDPEFETRMKILEEEMKIQEQRILNEKIMN